VTTTEERSKEAHKVIWTVGALIAIFLAIAGIVKTTKSQRQCIWFGLIAYFYVVLAWLDYIVVFVISKHPVDLMFYWLALATIYIGLAFVVSWQAFMHTNNAKTAARHGLTILLILVGSLADWFFFVIQGLPDLNAQWLWLWQGLLFGYWTGYLQIGWSLFILGIIGLVWTKLR